MRLLLIVFLALGLTSCGPGAMAVKTTAKAGKAVVKTATAPLR